MRRSRVEFLLFFRLKDILPTELIFNQSFWLVSAGMFWLQAYDLATQVLTNRSFLRMFICVTLEKMVLGTQLFIGLGNPRTIVFISYEPLANDSRRVSSNKTLEH